jgi:hypothetical protein
LWLIIVYITITVYLLLSKIHCNFLSYGFHFDVNGQQGQFLAAFRAFSLILLENFIGRLKICAFVQYVIASLTDDALRHYMALPEITKITSAPYLLVTNLRLEL